MRKLLRRSSHRTVILLAAVLAVSALYWTGCGQDNSNSPVTAPGRSEITTSLSMSNPQVRAVMAVQDQHTPELMADPNVVGTATGINADGNLVIKVYLEKASARTLYPVALDGIEVETEVMGIIRPLKGPPGGGGGGGGGGVSHTAIQTPPIELGTSGGWRYDLANGYCCGGTLGSLIKIGNTQYVLSNYHVLKADIVSGGNNRVAQNGDPVIQPALIDIGCNAGSGQDVATLAGSASLPGSNVDAAIAQVISGMVRTDGSILEIGTISASTVGASINQGVKKSGRTTGLSRSKVSGLNATISVAYENECAGGSAFTKTYTGQIVISNKGSKFLAGGDSGSLMVEDVSTNPRAVGLLYAGSSSSAIANPINEVLSFFNATMVGN